MTEEKETAGEEKKEASHGNFIHNLDRSALWVVVGIILFFSTAVSVVLIAPRHIDSTWTSPTSPYQVQMYEVSDPNYYMSSGSTGGNELQYVHHLKEGFSLLSFKESENLRIIASEGLEKYITRHHDPQLKLTSRLLMLREPEGEGMVQAATLQNKLQLEWKDQQKVEKEPPPKDPQKKGEKGQLTSDSQEKVKKVKFQIVELYDPHLTEAFSFDPSGGILQDWIDEKFVILDKNPNHPHHQDYGVVYVQNPREFRVISARYGDQEHWRYDPTGKPIKNLEELKSAVLGFHSRKELISMGETTYAIEGCWYCHTDQTRTLIEDVVLNGSDSYPAPPSSANEFIYQKITFPGTRRIGPDLSRVGVKRPSRDWHKSHFWAPKTASVGSIMPAFQHFFDNDPRGTSKNQTGIPNHRFEAMYQYLMTKGTRITPPTQAWWLGKDPINTKEIIEGQRKLP